VAPDINDGEIVANRHISGANERYQCPVSAGRAWVVSAAAGGKAAAVSVARRSGLTGPGQPGEGARRLVAGLVRRRIERAGVGQLPRGTVTFLMSDAEGSSAVWQRQPAAADSAFARLDVVVGDAVSRGGGVLLKARGEGDSHFAVFDRASAAVGAAVAIQRTMGSTPFEAAIAVRIGVHTGEPILREGDSSAR
jgi:class 3 adenylate cyclase